MDSTCLQRLRRRELEGGYTIPRRTCRGRPIVCPGPCNPRFKAGQRQEGRHNEQTSKGHQHSPRTEATYEQVYGQETTYEQGITYEEITYGADGETVEAIAVDHLTTYNEISLEATSSKQVLPGRSEVTKGPSYVSGRSAPRSVASSPHDPSGKLSSKPSARTDGGTTAGQSAGQIVASTDTPTARTTDQMTGQMNGEMTGADCRRCFLMCLKALFRAIAKVVKKLGGSAGLVEAPPCVIGLTIFVVFHGLLAVIAWQMPQYQVFLSSQICGLLAVVSWSIAGTLPFLDTRPTEPPCVCQPCA